MWIFTFMKIGSWGIILFSAIYLFMSEANMVTIAMNIFWIVYAYFVLKLVGLTERFVRSVEEYERTINGE